MSVRVEDLPIEVSHGELVTRYAEFGDMGIRHATLPAGTDMSPVLHGLPGDRCPSPHWGIVLSGSIAMTHAEDQRKPLAPVSSTTGRPVTPAPRKTAQFSSRSDRFPRCVPSASTPRRCSEKCPPDDPLR
jgi:hypothetical protein